MASCKLQHLNSRLQLLQCLLPASQKYLSKCVVPFTILLQDELFAMYASLIKSYKILQLHKILHLQVLLHSQALSL